MVIQKNSTDEYLVFLCTKIDDIFEKEAIKQMIQKVYKKVYTKLTSGVLYFNIYLDKNDNCLINLNKIDVGRDDLEIKIIFHLENDFFYKVDDLFDFKLVKQLYYYDHDFYLRIDNFLSEKDILRNLELYDISYGDLAFMINNDGVRLKCL